MSARKIAFDGRTFDDHRQHCVRDARKMIERAAAAQASGYPLSAKLHLAAARNVLAHAQFWRAKMQAAQVQS